MIYDLLMLNPGEIYHLLGFPGLLNKGYTSCCSIYARPGVYTHTHTHIYIYVCVCVYVSNKQRRHKKDTSIPTILLGDIKPTLQVYEKVVKPLSSKMPHSWQ